MEEDTVETIAALQAKLAEKDKQLQEQIQANTASKQLDGNILEGSDQLRNQCNVL